MRVEFGVGSCLTPRVFFYVLCTQSGHMWIEFVVGSCLTPRVFFYVLCTQSGHMWIEFVVGSCLTPRVFSMYSVPSQVICGLSLVLVLASHQGFFFYVLCAQSGHMLVEFGVSSCLPSNFISTKREDPVNCW